jgi:hypothetical protein
VELPLSLALGKALLSIILFAFERIPGVLPVVSPEVRLLQLKPEGLVRSLSWSLGGESHAHVTSSPPQTASNAWTKRATGGETLSGSCGLPTITDEEGGGGGFEIDGCHRTMIVSKPRSPQDSSLSYTGFRPRTPPVGVGVCNHPRIHVAAGCGSPKMHEQANERGRPARLC